MEKHLKEVNKNLKSISDQLSQLVKMEKGKRPLDEEGLVTLRTQQAIPLTETPKVDLLQHLYFPDEAIPTPDNPNASIERYEIERLANFLLKRFPNEIGKGDIRNGESAVDVAIRLLSAEAIK